MVASLNIVEFKPPLTDIPAMLRGMADDIESGAFGDVKTMYALVPKDGDYPLLFGWGNVDGTNDPIIQIELAKAWLVNNLVQRAP